jgi:hypothetical protein
MGKAGILQGGKGDIMIPNAHINEGTADNYFFNNELTASMFAGNDIPVFAGPMVTVLGTSLQNKDLLKFFHESTWGAIGLEMEGAYYQKAIQSASKIRKSKGRLFITSKGFIYSEIRKINEIKTIIIIN